MKHNATSPAKFLFAIIFMLSAVAGRATNYYWVGGTGDWSDYANHWATTSGGQVYHVQEPTPFDNVIFDNQSFATTNDTVYIGPTIFTCNDMTWTGVTNHPTFYGNSSTGELRIYGSFALDTSLTWLYGGSLTFDATTTGKTITTAGQYVLGGFTFNGIGGSWMLMDTLNTSGVNVQHGSFDSNNQVMNLDGSFSSGNGASCTIDLGTSEINLQQSWNLYAPASTTLLDADSCTINLYGGGGNIFYGGTKQYHFVNFLGTYNSYIENPNNTFDRVTVTSNLRINDNNTFDSLFFFNPGKTITFKAAKTQTIIDSIYGAGTCAGLTLLRSSFVGQNAIITKNGGTAVLSGFLIQDINATGTATFIANGSVPLSNVNGWNFPPVTPQNLYWVGGTGNWSDPTHWSFTSGGAGGSCLPTPYDNVIFDSLSFPTPNDSVNLDSQYGYCNNMDWTSATGTPTFWAMGSTLNLYGSLTFIDSMSTYGLMIYFEANTMGQTITSATKRISLTNFEGTGGWTLMDTLNADNINVNSGNFDSNNQVINVGTFTSGTGAICSIDLGTSEINLLQNWSINIPAFTTQLDADSCTINMNGSGGVIFEGGSKQYHFVNLFDPYNNFITTANNTFDRVTVTGNLSITDNNTFDSLFFYNPGKTITLTSGKTQTIVDSLYGSGTCAALTLMKSSSSGQTSTISKANGTVVVSAFLMQDITGTGGAAFIANSSVQTTNVNGWNFPPSTPQNLYWVGGTGNWDDLTHWSFTSGGAGGSCIPTPYDNVFFDSLSFPTPNDSVMINTQHAYCNNIDWTGATGIPNFMSTMSGDLNVYGSLTFIDSMNVEYTIILNFNASTMGQTITSAGNYMGAMSFNGNGGWMLMDTLSAAGINVQHGSFDSNNQQMNLSGFNSGNGATCSIDLGTSEINIDNSWNMYVPATGVTLDADSCTINFVQSGGNIFYGGNKAYHNVNFLTTGNAFIENTNTFDKVMVRGAFYVNAANTYDTLYFNCPGLTVRLKANATQTINSSLLANANGGYPIALRSTTSGVPSTISMPLGDTACLNYIYMQDQIATGGGIFYAGLNSSNISNNTGWQFTSCVLPISDVWPGDANYDLVTDNVDILNIGIAFNETGFVRPGASTNYVAQPCLDWPSQFITGVNAKHADTDGDGIVTLNDTLAVSLNYGQPHPPRLLPDSTQTVLPDLFFVLPPTAAPGSTLIVPVQLGTAALPASNVYGTAFTVNYPASMLSAPVGVSYAGSWLVSSNNNVHLEKDFQASSRIDLGFSRINHSNVSGNGTIVTLIFHLSNTASGPFMLTFTNPNGVDNIGTPVGMNPLPGTVTVGINDPVVDASIALFPNPSGGAFNLLFGDAAVSRGAKIDVTDLFGRPVLSMISNGDAVQQIDPGSVGKGVYTVTISLPNGSRTVKKLVIK